MWRQSARVPWSPHISIVLARALPRGPPGRLAPLDPPGVPHGGEPHVDADGERGAEGLQDPADERHASDRTSAGTLAHAAARDRPPAGGDRGALRRPLAGATLHRPPARLPAGGGLLRDGRAAELVVVVELAGVDPASIEIAVEERSLLISGQRSRPRVAGQHYQQAEIEYGPFERRLALGARGRPRRVEPPTRTGCCGSRCRSQTGRAARRAIAITRA